MQIANMTTGAATGDGLNNLAGRVLIKATGLDGKDQNAAPRAPGLYDPSSRVSLSVDAMLFLSRSQKAPEKQPALSAEEWSNHVTPALASREFRTFGKYGQAGDTRAYYRAYIEYYDGLRPEDQNSPRYFGTREAALAGLRSLEYSEQAEGDEQPDATALMEKLLDSQKRSSAASFKAPTAGESAGFAGPGLVTYAGDETSEDGLSNIQKLYGEVF